MNDIGNDKKQQCYIIKKMINIAIRATYYIFCCRNRNWDSPDLMQFWFFFFGFCSLLFFLIIQSQKAFVNCLYVARFTIVYSKTQINFPLFLFPRLAHAAATKTEMVGKQGGVGWQGGLKPSLHDRPSDRAKQRLRMCRDRRGLGSKLVSFSKGFLKHLHILAIIKVDSEYLRFSFKLKVDYFILYWILVSTLVIFLLLFSMNKRRRTNEASLQ